MLLGIKGNDGFGGVRIQAIALCSHKLLGSSMCAYNIVITNFMYSYVCTTTCWVWWLSLSYYLPKYQSPSSKAILCTHIHLSLTSQMEHHHTVFYLWLYMWCHWFDNIIEWTQCKGWSQWCNSICGYTSFKTIIVHGYSYTTSISEDPPPPHILMRGRILVEIPIKTVPIIQLIYDYVFALQFVVNLQQNGKRSLMCSMPLAVVR